MPPILALVLSLGFTAYLFWYDYRRMPKTSVALWIPFFWLTILGSRALSLWISLAPMTSDQAGSIEQGSPLDRNFYTVLMIAGLIVLVRRRVPLFRVLRENAWLVLFFLYCGLSLLWSDFPSIASKRWIKSFGDPIIVLVVLTEASPVNAVVVLLRRIAFLLLPLSVVFIKYFPELGRDYDPWTGWAFYTGVTTNKNMLGYLLFIFGLFFTCALLGRFGRTRDGGKRMETGIAVVFLLIVSWLFQMSDSKTPLMCLFLAVLIYLGAGWSIARRYWGSFILTALLVFGILQVTIDVTALAITSAGRNTTLTGRTDVWQSTIELTPSAWFGTGYSSFWLGERLEKMWSLYFFKPTQAHNGYIEMYLNLGWIGVGCLVAVIASGYRTIRSRWVRYTGAALAVVQQRDFARFGMAYLVALLVYNITEATFHALNILFVVCLLSIMRAPEPVAVSSVEPARKPGAGRLRRFGPRGLPRPVLGPGRDARPIDRGSCSFRNTLAIRGCFLHRGFGGNCRRSPVFQGKFGPGAQSRSLSRFIPTTWNNR